MWPKAFAQFVELAPHIGRLLPLADSFLQSRKSGDDATRTAVAQLTTATEALRADLGEVSASSTTLTRLLDEQAERTAVLAAAVDTQTRASRELAERLQAELTAGSGVLRRAETQLGGLRTLLLVNMALSLVLLAAVAALWLHLK